MRGAVRQLLEARRAAQLHAAALQELRGGYRATGESTDFEAQLSARRAALAEQQP